MATLYKWWQWKGNELFQVMQPYIGGAGCLHCILSGLLCKKMPFVENFSLPLQSCTTAQQSFGQCAACFIGCILGCFILLLHLQINFIIIGIWRKSHILVSFPRGTDGLIMKFIWRFKCKMKHPSVYFFSSTTALLGWNGKILCLAKMTWNTLIINQWLSEIFLISDLKCNY